MAEQLHFGRAAARLGIAQPPLSQQIRQLEADLGAQLFERTSRYVALTPAGAALLEDARRILREVREAEEAVRRIARGEAGLLRIGFVGSAMDSVLPDIVRRYRAAHPGVELTLHERTTSEQITALRERAIDVGLVRPPLAVDGITVTNIQREPLVVALPTAHPLAGWESVSLGSLAREPFILFRRALGEGLYDDIMQACHEAGFGPDVAQEANQMHTIVGLVSAGLGVALVPESVSRLRPDTVAYRPLNDTRIDTTLAVAHRAGDSSPLLARFMDVVSSSA